MRPTILATLTLLAIATLAPTSRADEPAKPDLPADAIKFSKPKAALYDTLFIFNKEDHSGAGTVVKSDEHRFLHLRVMINYQLPEDAENVNIGSDQINLVQNGGKTFPAVGTYDRDKVFSNWPGNIWLHSSNRRRNSLYDIVYAIPKDATGPFALVLGDHKTLRVELPKKTTKPPHPADMAKVEVKSVAWGDSVPGETIRVGEKEIKTTFTVPGRRLLAVSFLVHALEYNDSDGERLNWGGDALTLRDKQGNLYPTHGGLFGGRINPNVGHSSNVGETSTEAKILFFSPPDDIESFEVLWFGRPVTTYQIKK